MRAPRSRRALPAAGALLLLCLGPAGAGGRAPAPIKSGSRFRLLIQRTFPQAEIQDGGAGADEKEYRFKVFDERNGYARVVGPFDGYMDFFLFRGKLRDHVIDVEYDCGAACRQRMTVYRFDSGAGPVQVPLMGVLDLAGFDATRRRLMSLCLDSDGNFETNPDVRDKAHRDLPACPFVFSFSKKGSAPILFKVVDENGSDMMLSVAKTKVEPKAILRWNGDKLVGSEPRDAGSIFLDDKHLRALF